MQSCLNMFLNEKAALIHTASLLWTFGLNSQSTWVSCDFPPQYHRGEIPFHYPLLLRWTSLFTVLPPGDGLWRGASLHGALWPVSALAGDRRSARCGSPGQRHLPGTLLSDQASLACPTNSHCDLQRGLFHCSLGECRSAKAESPHNMRSNFFSPSIPLADSLHGDALMGSRVLVSTCWWLWLTFLSSWSGPPMQTTWLRAGIVRVSSVTTQLMHTFQLSKDRLSK